MNLINIKEIEAIAEHTHDVQNRNIHIAILILVASFFSSGELTAQEARTSYTINSNWKFHKGSLEVPVETDNISWEPVSLPHTWNSEDVYDDEPGYYRGEGWYYKKFIISAANKSKKVFLEFKGVNQETEVYINGKHAGGHIGGYSAFIIPITEHVIFGEENEVLVKVNNRFHEDIPTLTADFTFFGGIYRDVYITYTNDIHFSMDSYGSSGVRISTPNVSAQKAEVFVEGEISNKKKRSQKVEVRTYIKDAENNIVATASSSYNLKAGEEVSFTNKFKNFNSPHLWSIEDPYLYNVVTQIYDVKESSLLDEDINPLGFRWFRFDAAEGFLLNGQHVKLIGVNRHQDYKGLGNALPKPLHERDVKLAKSMGANFLRIAHYPHDRSVLDACDRLGIIATVEIPIVNTITESEAFAKNSESMMKEMIYQDYNHPSLVVWAYMNEVLLRLKYKEDPERQEVYFKNVANLARKLEKLARSLDPYRYTMIPNHGSFDLYKKVGLTEIPMIVGWNLYQGWYGRDPHNFAKFLDKHREELSHKPLIVTEYGAGADPRLRATVPERFDFSLEYQTFYHQVYMKAILERPFVAGVNVWNLADFSSEGRIDAVPNINNKGILTYDRKPKDAFYLYQAYLLDKPFITIGSKLWSNMSGVETKEGISEQKVAIFTNQDNATLYHNGQSLGEKSVVDHTTSWNVSFVNGVNHLEVNSKTEDGTIKDIHTIDFHLVPLDLKSMDFNSLLVNLGDKRHFLDDLTKEVWLPGKKYEEGSWGSIGGEEYCMDPAPRQSYGTDLAISGTENDPLFQTQMVGLEEFKADVPEGRYELTLHFAELIPQETGEVLAYNLDSGGNKITTPSKRIFDVMVNGQLVLNDINLEETGRQKAVSFSILTTVHNDNGLQVKFIPVEGEPVLNAIRIEKVF